MLNILLNVSKVERVSTFKSKYGVDILSLHLCSHYRYRWPYVLSNVDTLLALVV